MGSATPLRRRFRLGTLVFTSIAAQAFACGGVDTAQSSDDTIASTVDDLTAVPYARILDPHELTTSTTPRLVGYDWAAWGLSGTNANRKSGVTTKLVDNYTKVGTGAIAPYAPNGTYPQLRWTDGTPTVSATTPNGVGTANVGTGFKVRVTATPDVRTVNVYLTVFNAEASVAYNSSTINNVPVKKVSVAPPSTRKVLQFEIDVHSARIEDGYVTVKFEKSLGGGAFVALHAVALGQYPDRDWSVISYSLRSTNPPDVVQPPLYWAGPSDYYTHPIDVVGSRITIPDLTYDAGGQRQQLFGSEIWRDGVVMNEGPGLSGLNYTETIAADHTIQIALIGNLGSRTPLSEPRHIYPYGWGHNETPQAIPDLACIDQPIVVTSEAKNGVVRHVDVSFSIDHTFDGDLDTYLISPTGKSVRIVSRVGSSGHDFAGTRVTTGALGLACPRFDDGAPPYSNVFQPTESLVPMIGEPMKGTWKLRVCDRASLDTGTLKWARLFLEPG